jgi:UDP-N-acetylglucosamine 2-epimerase (non-hydrolysing)
MKRITFIIGTRPNFIKASSLYHSLKKYFDIILIHTGQHTQSNMYTVFFKQLHLPVPDYSFEIKSKSKANILDNELYNNYSPSTCYIDILLHNNNLGQISEIRNKIRLLLYNLKPNLVIVFGDVTSTLAGTLAAYSLQIPIAHIESGLRSGDLSMPEEVNRILVDKLSTYYFISEPSGLDNLRGEGYSKNLYLVGNTMIDTLKNHLNDITNCTTDCITKFNFKNYIVVTLHRPNNVDNNIKLSAIIEQLNILANKYMIVFPIHPRTKSKMKLDNINNIHFIEPLGYFEFIKLLLGCVFVITDSGGIQEETTSLGIRCYTIRQNTERPITLVSNGGTNSLINDINEIEENELNLSHKNTEIIDKLWDGNTSFRIRQILEEIL